MLSARARASSSCPGFHGIVLDNVGLERVGHPFAHPRRKFGGKIGAVRQRLLQAGDALGFLDQCLDRSSADIFAVTLRTSATRTVSASHLRQRIGDGFADIGARGDGFLMRRCSQSAISCRKSLSVSSGLLENNRARDFDQVVGQKENEIVRRGGIVRRDARPARCGSSSRHRASSRRRISRMSIAFALVQMRVLDPIKRGDREVDFLARRVLRIGGKLGKTAHVAHVTRCQSHVMTPCCTADRPFDPRG